MESDERVLKSLGERLARHRLNRNQTQAQVAREAGVARRTIYKAENGLVIDTQSLVRILRALDLLERLEALVPEARVSPMALAEARGHVRERASGYRKARDNDEPAAEWTWPDEER
ncbi:MAG TPA: helix-turn-helix transcriptional regulator [Gammaproteobacteria bacterium]|nr:helix-turn-helix transcriptional regulator [Gammaproteobacteria bacterium]